MNTGIKFSVPRPLLGTAASSAEPESGRTKGRGVPLLLPIDPTDGGPSPTLEAAKAPRPARAARLKEQIVLPRIRPAMGRAE